MNIVLKLYAVSYCEPILKETKKVKNYFRTQLEVLLDTDTFKYQHTNFTQNILN